MFAKFGEFFPDLANAGADMEPLLNPPPPPPAEFFPELKDGETDLPELDLFEDNDEEIEDGMLSGFSFTVGVFFKLLPCKSDNF